MQEYYEKKYMFFFLALGMLNFSEFQRPKKIQFFLFFFAINKSCIKNNHVDCLLFNIFFTHQIVYYI